jgi:maleylpyruvate isomerase
MTSAVEHFHDANPADQLTITRRGTAYFGHMLTELRDDEFDMQSLLPGWSRRHLVAHVGYNAKALCRLMDWAATGVETPMYESREQRVREIETGAQMDPAALRQFFVRAAGQLDEKWKHHPQRAWSAVVRTAQGRQVPASETVWLRAREVWVHAVDLATTGRFADFPSPVNQTLLDDVVAFWRAKGAGAGLVLAVADRQPIPVQPQSPICTTVTGSLSAVTRWAAGRGAVGCSFSDGSPIAPPSWL